ncbi:FadR/GntR family transcriptional regulator [Amygdalobacter nucleatus]|uniref:FadR/GntR family transcriptional regulator n=1 Tax=Amygdalobacter nucleatus TaxID=3029274 RepID=UPI0027A188C5|nr:GntR family transcriptional regulator [Amygdalobacter nucleatus]WEG37138.1 GntR family transcriptional regulator [Amygdalobacter nucleatus]
MNEELKLTSLEPIERDALYLKIADAIYSYVRLNKLQQGDKLPSERKLAESLQISRNSLREALRLLEARGILYAQVGKGVFVDDIYGQKGKFVAQISGYTLDEMRELQILLDHKAVANAIEKGGVAEKERLVSIAQNMQLNATKGIYSHTLDFDFHHLLYKMNDNKAIHQLLDRIRDERYICREDMAKENTDIWLQTVPQHLSLSLAIQANDIKSAIAEMDKILNYGFKLLGVENKNQV